MKKKWSLIGGIGVLLLFLLFYWMGFSGKETLTEPEKEAVHFYQSLWQKQNKTEAVSQLHPRTREIGKGVINATLELNDPNPSKTVFITENPNEEQTETKKSYFIYSLETTVEINLNKEKEIWWVVYFGEAEDTYEELNTENQKLEKLWKEAKLN